VVLQSISVLGEGKMKEGSSRIWSPVYGAYPTAGGNLRLAAKGLIAESSKLKGNSTDYSPPMLQP
jgi:hypothetical protein